MLAVFTHRNMPRMNPTPKPWSHLHPHGQGYLPLQDDQIHYAGQPIALVVAATLDQAAHAGTLIKVEYEARAAGRCSTPRPRSEAVDPPQFLWPVLVGRRRRQGNRGRRCQDRADLHDAPIAITTRWSRTRRLAVWDADGTLTLYDTTQHIFGTKELVVDRARHTAGEDQRRFRISSAAASAARPMSGRIPCWRRSPRKC